MGIITDIQRFSVDDGPGIRTTVFLKGCNLNCAWCHNPETKDPQPQKRTVAGRETVCGREVTPAELFEAVNKDAAYYRRSGGGVTFSGGEPLLQLGFLTECLKLCRDAGLHTAVDTAGFVGFGAFESVMPLTDLFLYDVKLIDDENHIKYTGVSNKPILENLGKLIKTGAKVTVRTLLLPGANDNDEYFARFAALMVEMGVEKVDVLPYHGMGEGKYTQIGEEYRFGGRKAPDEKLTQRFREIIGERIGAFPCG